MSTDTFVVIIDGRLRLLGTEDEARAEYDASLAAYRPAYHHLIHLCRLVEVGTRTPAPPA